MLTTTTRPAPRISIMLVSCLLYYVLATLYVGQCAASSVSSRNVLSPHAPLLDTVRCNDATKKRRIQQALADMSNLALHGFYGANKSSLGFTHYFDPSELEVFVTAMSMIAANNDPTQPPYWFIVDCHPSGSTLEACNQSYVQVDTSVSHGDGDRKTMWICPRFWNGSESAQDLPRGWDQIAKFCAQDDYKAYVTAGHVLLHAITRLDAVARLFLSQTDSAGRHGAREYTRGPRPIAEARWLRIMSSRNSVDNTSFPPPTSNAESYAGAATELWAQTICNKTFIPPEQGY